MRLVSSRTWLPEWRSRRSYLKYKEYITDEDQDVLYAVYSLCRVALARILLFHDVSEEFIHLFKVFNLPLSVLNLQEMADLDNILRLFRLFSEYIDQQLAILVDLLLDLIQVFPLDLEVIQLHESIQIVHREESTVR